MRMIMTDNINEIIERVSELLTDSVEAAKENNSAKISNNGI